MAKGDSIHVVTRGSDFRDGVTVNGMVHNVRASKAGRTVKWRTVTRGKEQWALVEEVTRFGRPTGTRTLIRMSEVVAVIEDPKDEARPSRAKPKKASPFVTPTIWPEAEA